MGDFTSVLTLLVRASDDLEEHHNDPNRIEYFLPNLFAFDGLSYAPEIKKMYIRLRQGEIRFGHKNAEVKGETWVVSG